VGTVSETRTLKLVVATFENETDAARALATIIPGLGLENIGQGAVVSRNDDGKVKFVETHDRTTGQAALAGAGVGAFAGLLGILFTPVALLGLPIGAGVGALIGKLKDSGFEDDELKELGADLEAGKSALVATIEVDDIDKAKRLLAEVGASKTVVKEIDSDLAAALDEEAAAVGPTPLSTATTSL
jgi:uncharacterized membrane protein